MNLGKTLTALVLPVMEVSMATRKTPEELIRDQLTRLVRDRFTGVAAELMCRMVEELPRRSQLWNVRTAKAKFSEVLALVRTGYPQFVQREGDEEPVMLISLTTMIDFLERGVIGKSYTESMAPFMQHTSTALAVPELGEMDRLTIPI